MITKSAEYISFGGYDQLYRWKVSRDHDETFSILIQEDEDGKWTPANLTDIGEKDLRIIHDMIRKALFE